MGEFWYHFRRKKLAFFSFVAFMVIFIISLFAPIIANDRAILIYKDSRIFLPFIFDYTESDFVDSRELQILGESQKSITPPPAPPLKRGGEDIIESAGRCPNPHLLFAEQKVSKKINRNKVATSGVVGEGERLRGGGSDFAIQAPPPLAKMRANRDSSESENGRNGEFFGKFENIDARKTNALYHFGIDYADPNFRAILGDAFILNPPIPYSYNTIIYDLDSPPPSAPSAKNLLGTDDKGRDLFARLLYGVRISLIFGIILSVLSSAIGVCVGALQGFYGGKIDIFTQRLVEIWASVPILFALIIISSFIAPTFWRILFIVLLFSWISLVGFVRAEFLRVRNFDFVKASRALGASDFSIAFRHILPNALISATTYFPFILAGSIATLTTLDFLGFGLPSDYASLGEILNQGKDNLNAPHIGIIGFLTISILLSLLVFIGEGVRDSLNPKHSRHLGDKNAF